MMSRARVLFAQMYSLFHRDRREQELDDEVRFHLQMQEEDNLRSGMSSTEAHYAAMRSFGQQKQ